jgi:hypothetical protein
MTPQECAAAVAHPIGDFGSRFMLDPSVYSAVNDLGYEGFDFYFVGRGGVLGDGPSDAAEAAMAFMHSEFVRASWDRGRAAAPVHVTVERFAEQCAQWGRDHFTADVDYLRVGELATLAINQAPAAGIPLFAAWRALPVPSDGKGAVAHQLNVLREFRGGSHIIALLASGLTPLDAVLTNAGTFVAQMFGHPGPFGEVDHLRETAQQAEILTTSLAARAFAGLTETEREEFSSAVLAIHASIT